MYDTGFSGMPIETQIIAKVLAKSHDFSEKMLIADSMCLSRGSDFEVEPKFRPGGTCIGTRPASGDGFRRFGN